MLEEEFQKREELEKLKQQQEDLLKAEREQKAVLQSDREEQERLLSEAKEKLEQLERDKKAAAEQMQVIFEYIIVMLINFRPKNNICGSGCPTYPKFLPPTLNLFSKF